MAAVAQPALQGAGQLAGGAHTSVILSPKCSQLISIAATRPGRSPFALFLCVPTSHTMLKVGQRVVIAKHKGTVRYIGGVNSQQGVWVGVEWDDASRGKHDGSTGGTQYFTCSSGTSSGSFVRIEKVPLGSTLLEALRARYTNQRAEGSGAADGEVFLRTAANHKVLVELVGEDEVTQRQSQLDRLTSARVVGAGVASMVRHAVHGGWGGVG